MVRLQSSYDACRIQEDWLLNLTDPLFTIFTDLRGSTTAVTGYVHDKSNCMLPTGLRRLTTAMTGSVRGKPNLAILKCSARLEP